LSSFNEHSGSKSSRGQKLVKANPAEQAKLLQLQTIDTRIQQLDHAAKNLPQLAPLAALTPRVDAAKRQLAARQGELEDARIELSRIESDVSVVEARIVRDSGRLEHTSSMKDVQALESELVALRKRRNDLEEIELTVMERVEEIEAHSARTAHEYQELQAEFENLETVRLEEKAKIVTKQKALSDDRRVIAETIDAELLALYENQRTRYGTGAALLVRGVSMGSNVKLTESDMADIRRAAPDDVVLCPDSGAILIRNVESGL
jgi:predicted  nucleic acid-binding Zn-ribbon protein